MKHYKHIEDKPGHKKLAVERFHDDTRHMIEFTKMSCEDRRVIRLFLTDVEYEEALESARAGRIKIQRHADIIEGHILYDKKRRRKR